MKTITLGEFIDNIEKNGYKQAFGGLFRHKKTGNFKEVKKKSEIGEACALGQGMLNLNARAIRSDDPLIFENFIDRVVSLNDNDLLPPDEIARIVRKEFDDKLDTKLTVISFNDRFTKTWGGSAR